MEETSELMLQPHELVEEAAEEEDSEVVEEVEEAEEVEVEEETFNYP